MALIKFKDSKGNTYPHLYINTDSGLFYSVIRKGSRVFKSSLKTKDFNTARSRIPEKFKELEIKKDLHRPIQNKLLSDYFKEVIQEKEVQGNKASSMIKIETVWRLSLDPFWGHLRPDHISQDKVTEFMIWHQKNRPGIQFQQAFKYLGNLFRFLHERHLIMIRPKLMLPKSEIRHMKKKKGRVASEAERAAIIGFMSGDAKVITQMCDETGARQMEIGAMEVERVHFIEDQYVFILEADDTKNSLDRIIPIPKYLNSEIEKRMSNERYLFQLKSDSKRHIVPQMLDHKWQAAKKKARIIGRLRFHDLRHSCATRMAQVGINPAIACTILGMSLKTYIKVYLNLSTKDLIMATETFYKKNEVSHVC